MKKYCCLFLIAVGFSSMAFSQNTTPEYTEDDPEFYPEPIEFVYDMEAFFSKEDVNAFREKAAAYEVETGNEVILLVFANTAEFEDLETFAPMMAYEMQPGKEGKNNGATIVYISELNDLEIVAGEGAKKALTDKFIYTLKEKKIVPLLEKEQAFQAIMTSLDEIIKKWPKEKS
jgi:uncharacterized membrane protein YgcG